MHQDVSEALGAGMTKWARGCVASSAARGWPHQWSPTGRSVGAKRKPARGADGEEWSRLVAPPVTAPRRQPKGARPQMTLRRRLDQLHDWCQLLILAFKLQRQAPAPSLGGEWDDG